MSTNKYVLQCSQQPTKHVKTLQQIMTVGNTYYAIISVDCSIVHTTNNKRQPITLYNYSLITIYDNNMNELTEELPTYYTSYSTMETHQNIYYVNMFRITIYEQSKKVEHVEMTPTVIKSMFTNNVYRQYISNKLNISVDDVYRVLSCDYLIEYSPKHTYLLIPIVDNKIYLTNVYSISRDYKHAHKVFNKVAPTTLYTKRMRDNISYKYTVGKELLYKLFDKLLANELDDVRILDYESKVMLFGNEITLFKDTQWTH